MSLASFSVRQTVLVNLLFFVCLLGGWVTFQRIPVEYFPETLERAGFHQSSHPGALAMQSAEPSPVRLTTMGSRRRGTVATGAIDIVTEPNTPITAPITGRW